MKRKNKLIKVISAGLLGSALASGLLCMALPSTETLSTNPSSAYESVTNSTPDFFASSFVKGGADPTTLYENYAFVDSASNEKVKLSFSTETETYYTPDEGEPYQIPGTYYNGSKYLAFEIGTITVSINGKPVEGIDYSTAIDLTRAGVDPAYTFPYGLAFYPESLDLSLTVDPGASSSAIKDGLLTLNEQGLVTVIVSYTQYEMTAKYDATNQIMTLSVDADGTTTGNYINYDFFLLDRNTYLELGSSDSPKFENSSIIEKNLSGTSTYKHNYFYNHKSNEVPSFTYNASNYEVTIMKVGTNNATTTSTIKYNPASKTIGIYDNGGTSVTNPGFEAVLNGEEITLYFHNLGEYIFKYEPICIVDGITYSVGCEMLSDRFYMFGYQGLYTIKSATYSEIKEFSSDRTSYINPADITYLFNLTSNPLSIDKIDTDTENTLDSLFASEYFNENHDNFKQIIASTDRTPVKFQTLDGVNVSSSSKCYYSATKPDSEINWDEGTTFSIADNYSKPGYYFINLDYTFSSYTTQVGGSGASQPFKQYFAFQITKTTPSIGVYTIDEEVNPDEHIKLTDGAYTNDITYIKFENYANVYNKPVSIDLVRYDYNNAKTITETIDWYKDGENYSLTYKGDDSLNGGVIQISQDGNYTINIYQQGSTNPIVRKFNIDTNKEFHLASYAVEPSASTQNNYATIEITSISNQPLVFSWDNVKKSGATTKGYYKYYPISSTTLYEEDFIKDHLYFFIDKNIVPVEYQLNLDANNSWLQYTNFDYSVNSRNIVSSMYIKSSAGIYVLQTVDEAGNSQTKVYIIENSTPVFFLFNEAEGGTYTILTQNDTITEDAKIIWGKYKAVKVNGANFHDNNSDIYKDRNEEYNPQIYDAINALLSEDDLVNPNEDVNISFLNIPNAGSPYSCYYLTVEINDTVYFKNYNVSDNEYKAISGSDYNYSYEIVSSYKLYQHIDGEILRTITSQDGTYIRVDGKTYDGGFVTKTEFNSKNLEELKTYAYLNNGINYIVRYKDPASGSYIYNTFDPTNNKLGTSINYNITKSGDDLYYGSHLLSEQQFIDKEGTYVFLLRDKSNIQGSYVSERERYFSYPSAYEYLKVTADQSELRTYFIDAKGKEIELADSSYYMIDSKQKEDELWISKSSYFSPTNEDVVYITFKPTISSGDDTIQIDKVTVSYYEFKNASNTYVSELNNQLVYNYYKTKSTESTSFTIYSYDKDGAYADGEMISPYALNLANNKTKAGYYVITRTYKVAEGFVVATYDYHERTLNEYVDRYNVITATETINPRIDSNTVTYTNASAPSDIYSFTLYTNEEKTILYLPVEEDETLIDIAYEDIKNYQIFAYNKDSGLKTNVSARITLQLTHEGGTKDINWIDYLSQNYQKNSFTDTNGQRYVLLDFTNGIKVDGQNCTSFNSLDSNNIMIESTSYTADVKNATPDSKTSTQSIVGGSMLVTMYSNHKKGEVISLAHPGQTSNGVLLYGNGDSFYTREDTSNILDLSSLFNTNKLPVTISIPRYKYSTYFTKAEKTYDSNGRNVICNYVYETSELTYYLQSQKDSVIPSYQLDVEVEYYKEEPKDNVAPDKVYKSNGNQSLNTFLDNGVKKNEESGYLALYNYNRQSGAFSTEQREFTEAGYYVVRITQAPNEVESSSYNFKSTYSFKFQIENNAPEFELYSGTKLKSITDTNFYENIADSANYYTNKDEVSVVWTDSASLYKANIDKKKIYFSISGSKIQTNNANYMLSLTEPVTGEKGDVVLKKHDGTDYTIPLNADSFTYTYASSTLTNTLTFNLKTLQINTNDARATITMQLLGHDPLYYKTTTKTVIYDQTASNNTIASLHSLLYNKDYYGLNQKDIREYYLADGTTAVSDVSKASYNQTIANGTYAKYAFTVSRDFFDGIKANLKSNIDSKLYSSTTSIYYNGIDSYDTYTPTSNTFDFVEKDFTEIIDSTLFDDIQTSKYYEIVERDLAGNITTYIIYVTQIDGIYEHSSYGEEYQGILYNDSKITHTYDPDNIAENHFSIRDSIIETDNYELNGSKALKIELINLLGDEWNYFYTSIYSSSLGQYVNTYYLIAPELDDGFAYRITGVSTKTYTKVSLADLFKTSEGQYKNYLYILNKLTGNYDRVAVSLSDIASISVSTGEVGSGSSKSAYISVALSTSSLSKTDLIYARPISVRIYDKSGNVDTLIYSTVNNPNALDNITNSSYDYLNAWTNSGDNTVQVSYSNEKLTFTIPTVKSDTKLSYEIKDNFGNEIKEIYLVGETKVDPITSDTNLYTYYQSIAGVDEFAYIATNDIHVNYNSEKYSMKATLITESSTLDGTAGYTGIADKTPLELTSYRKDNTNNPLYIVENKKGSIYSYTFGSKQTQYDIIIKIEFFDVEDPTKPISEYYIRLYNVLPNDADDTDTTFDHYFTISNSNGRNDTDELLRERNENMVIENLSLNGKTYTVYSSTQTFSDQLKVAYSSAEDLDFPYEVFYYCANENWNNGSDFVPLPSGTILNQNGIYYILVRYSSTNVLTKEYYLFKIEILGSTGGFYYVLANGEIKQKAKTYYTDETGTQHSDYYIVNISHQDRNLTEKFEFIVNDYQNIQVFENSTPKFEATDIYTYTYLVTNYTADGDTPENFAEAENATTAPTEVGISPYKQFVYVTFLNPSNDILSISTGTTSYLYYKTVDTSESFVLSSTNEVNVIVYEEASHATDKMTLYWRKFYGIEANLITAYAEKDGRSVNLTIKEKEAGEYYYTELSRSGYFNIRFEDTAGNVQIFHSGQKTLPVVFIKDVHFTVEYTNPITQLLEQTEAINKGVYNGTVKLKINPLLIPYYQDSSFGQGNIITVYKNGEEYKEYSFSNEDYSFTFKETGFYSVSMSAYSKSTGELIRVETYSFTIINARESRYAYEFSGNQNYYIQSIIKDGVDITDSLFKSLKTPSNYTIVDNKYYLKNLLVSYFDEKTGGGKYLITICANDSLYVSENHDMSTFSFEFYINASEVPIEVSVDDGASTTGNVEVKFNAKNVYDAVGECYIVVGADTYYVNEATIDNVTLILGDNESRTTRYIQVYTMSGNLIFSQKVTLNEPMNTWTIIAIVGGCIAVAVIVFIVIKLRKRLGVK